jgi:very-short-patch-repair endonuclease
LKFRRQVTIGPYVVDFCCESARLIVELDGGQHATQQEQDAKRTEALEAQGYLVLRFWNNEVLQNIGGVLQSIVDILRAVPPHPSLSPMGRGNRPEQVA